MAIKYWETIADNLSKAGWNWGCVSAVDSEGRTIWVTDPHGDDGKRFVVRADEKLTAFVELESAVRVRCELTFIGNRGAESCLSGKSLYKNQATAD